jgi:hypothetical protein
VTQDERHSSDSQLGQDTGILLGGKRGHLHRTPCPWADALPGDEYAPAPCKCKCRDRADFLRREHDWSHESPKGTPLHLVRAAQGMGALVTLPPDAVVLLEFLLILVLILLLDAGHWLATSRKVRR